MTRENEYRAWDSAHNAMWSWAELGELNSAGHLSLWNLLNGFVDHIKPLQYTGKKDRNGKKIYEGDIINCEMSFEGGSLPHMGCIVYMDEFGAFATENVAGKTLLHNHLLNTFEVIGNIYQNPDNWKSLYNIGHRSVKVSVVTISKGSKS